MKRQNRSGAMQIPFGPFLALAALVYLFGGPELIQLWLGS